MKVVLLQTRPTTNSLVTYLALGSLFCYHPYLVTYMALDIFFGYQPSIWLQKPCHFVCLPTRPLTFCLVTYLILGTLFGYLPARLYFVWLPT